MTELLSVNESHESEPTTSSNKLTIEQKIRILETSLEELPDGILGAELETLTSKEELVRATWQCIANYHINGYLFGYNNPNTLELKEETNSRLKLLSNEDAKIANELAIKWFDK
jgi:hypothetical protein